MGKEAEAANAVEVKEAAAKVVEEAVASTTAAAAAKAKAAAETYRLPECQSEPFNPPPRTHRATLASPSGTLPRGAFMSTSIPASVPGGGPSSAPSTPPLLDLL